MKWTAAAYVADDEPFWSETDDNWAFLRIKLAQEIEPFLSDDCWDCRLAGVDAFNRLAALGYEKPFRAEIDGNMYVLRLSAKLPPVWGPVSAEPTGAARDTPDGRN